MMEIFNNREKAILIWIVIGILLVFFKPSIRKPVSELLKSLLKKNYATIYIIYITGVEYMVVMVLLLSRIELWKSSQLKDTILWMVLVLTPTLFNMKLNKEFFKGVLKNCLGLTVAIEFIIDFYTFNLFIELIIVPVSILITTLLVVAERDKKYSSLTKLFRSLLTIIACILILHSIYQIVIHFSDFASIDTTRTFLLSSILLIVFLPYAFVVTLYMEYEVVFVGLNNFIKQNDLILFTRKQAILYFNIDIEGLKRWRTQLSLLEPNSKSDILSSIKNVKKLQKIEKNPPLVDPSLGWSPYQAKDFLLEKGIKTGYYNCAYDEWGAVSFIELKNSILPNYLTYYVYGNDLAVTTLELRLDVLYIDDVKFAHQKLLEYAKVLYQKAVQKVMPIKIETALLKGKKENILVNDIVIAIDKTILRDGKYSMAFSIKHT